MKVHGASDNLARHGLKEGNHLEERYMQFPKILHANIQILNSLR